MSAVSRILISEAVDGAESGSAAIDAYLAAFPEPARTTLLAIRERIRAAAPRDAKECFNYGVPAFRMTQSIAGYTAGKPFCSYYPMSGRVITLLANELAEFETSKGAIRFPLDRPLSAALVRKLVGARVAELSA